MKRSELKRKTALQPGTKQLARSTPIARGSVQLRARKPKSAKPKRAARNAGPVDYLALCRGQACYLQLPGVLHHDPATVVPCHSNQGRHGKATALKALDVYTVPGCWHCHRELDQGARFTRAEKFALWDAAFARWQLARELLLFLMAQIAGKPHPSLLSVVHENFICVEDAQG